MEVNGDVNNSAHQLFQLQRILAVPKNLLWLPNFLYIISLFFVV